jgi:hypothetical protein
MLTLVTSQHAEGFEDEPPLLEELGINPDHILQVKVGGYLGTGFEDEPPLLEELGINPDHILQVRGSI